MSRAPNPPAESLALSWFRLLLRWFPRGFQRRMGESMEEAFFDGVEDARRRGRGPFGPPGT